MTSLSSPPDALSARIPPIIKWPGSKRGIAPLLGTLFPKGVTGYIEPFVGGGALLPFRPVREALAGDVIGELVALWLEVRDRPERVATEYEWRWNRLQADGHPFFYTVRDRFNADRDPHDLLFLSRTCVNGLIRFNAAGEFNNSLHHTRPGISPGRLRAVIQRWNLAVQGVEFVSADYRETLAGAGPGDLVFLDPPYGGTRGRYQPGRLDLQAFWAELDRLNRGGVRWVLTLDGVAGSRAYDTAVPEDLWQVRLGLDTGHSPFTRLMRTGLDRVVESVYLNYELGLSLDAPGPGAAGATRSSRTGAR